jgi:hypothetical protein
MEDIIQVPLFSASLSLVRTPAYYSGANFKSFKKLLQYVTLSTPTIIVCADKPCRDMHAASPSTSVAAMITRPPEIVACLIIHRPVDDDVFVIFDSHTRPNHPEGAGFILNTSADETARYLTTLLEVDNRLLPKDGDTQFQWQADLMRHFCAHILVSKRTRVDMENLTQTVLEASLTILNLKAELSALKQDNSFMAAEYEKFKKSVERRSLNSRHTTGSISHISSFDREPVRYVSQFVEELGNQYLI